MIDWIRKRTTFDLFLEETAAQCPEIMAAETVGEARRQLSQAFSRVLRSRDAFPTLRLDVELSPEHPSDIISPPIYGIYNLELNPEQNIVTSHWGTFAIRLECAKRNIQPWVGDFEVQPSESGIRFQARPIANKPESTAITSLLFLNDEKPISEEARRFCAAAHTLLQHYVDHLPSTDADE